MKCVILQPSYIPWRGFFHQIQKADIFVFYDDVEYDKRGWRNRNRIKSPGGSQWLTIPVLNKGTRSNHVPIKKIHINWDRPWNKKHWATICQVYGKAPYFGRYRNLLEDFYNRHPQLLTDFTIDLTIALAQELGIKETRYLRSSCLPAQGRKTDRLLSILRDVGATHYITGPSAKEYLEEGKFRSASITLEYMVYDYPEYQQLYPPYDSHMSILDLLFMRGPDAPRYIWQHQS
jgi:WbqC-like protein family